MTMYKFYVDGISLNSFLFPYVQNSSKDPKMKSYEDDFFKTILPNIIKLALQLPEIIKCPIPLLKRGQNKSISITQQQISCILANAFLCTFREEQRSINKKYPTINFTNLFLMPRAYNHEKIKCIINYFRKIFSQSELKIMLKIQFS